MEQLQVFFHNIKYEEKRKRLGEIERLDVVCGWLFSSTQTYHTTTFFYLCEEVIFLPLFCLWILISKKTK